MIKPYLLIPFLVCHLYLHTQQAVDFHINIGQATLEFNDESRSRPLKTEIWYPTTDSIKDSDKYITPFIRGYTVRNAALPNTKLPLILLSHGNGGNRLSLEWLAQGLVRQGYIVAAVDHWGNTFDHPIAQEFVKPWERPLDISYVLTALLKDKRYQSIIDEHKIGAAGFSYGGYTVLALAGAVLDYKLLFEFYNSPEGKKEINSIAEFPNLWDQLQDPALVEMAQNLPALKDNRIKAFLAISPGTARGFNNPQQFKEINDPLFIIGAEADQVTPVESFARKYHQLIANSTYYEFSGQVGHYVMLAEANEEMKKELPEPFTDHPSVDRKKIHAKVAALSAEFFNKHLRKK